MTRVVLVRRSHGRSLAAVILSGRVSCHDHEGTSDGAGQHYETDWRVNVIKSRKARQGTVASVRLSNHASHFPAAKFPACRKKSPSMTGAKEVNEMIPSKVRPLQALILLAALFAVSAAPGAHASQLPIGWLDVVTPDYRLVGWTLDPDSPEQNLDVHFYVDGPAGRGVLVGAVVANLPRPDVNNATGYPGDHGFSFAIPEQYRSGYR